MSLLCGSASTFFRHELPKLPGNYLEIGIYDGDLVALIAREFPDRHCYAIDPFIEDGNTSQHNGGVTKGQFMPGQHAHAIENFKSLPNVTLHQVPSIEFSKTLDDALIDKMNISAVLIDGSHWYADADNDFKMTLRLLKNGGIIYADDLGIEGVAKACAEFVERDGSRISKRNGEAFWISPAP